MRVVSLLTLLASGLAYLSVADAKLVKLAVLHRHGARSGSSVLDGQVICEYPHCQLTGRGIDQLKAVGKVIMREYKDALGLPSTYNVSYINSISTEVPRVVVSAQAVLQGMYEGQEPLPFIKFDLDGDNAMLSPWNGVPSFVLANRYDVATKWASPVTFRDLSMDNITYMANYLGMYDQCVTRKDPYTCVAIIYDNYNCNYTEGIPVDPAIEEMIPRLKPVVAQFANYMLGYQPTTNTWSREVGSLGYLWAADAIKFLLTPNAHGDLTVMKHYGAHDWTITALYGALGFVTADNAHKKETVPMFAQTVVFELHEDEERVGNEAVVTKTVKIKSGYPSNHPTGVIDFSLDELAVLCKKANGAVYYGTDGCPLEDLNRYVESTKAQSPDGHCHYTREMMEAVGCLDPAAPAPKSRCLFFRQKCPQVACALIEGSIPDPRNGHACTTQIKADNPQFFAATVAAMVAPSLLAGAIVGFFSAGGLRKFLHSKSVGTAEERQPMNQS